MKRIVLALFLCTILAGPVLAQSPESLVVGAVRDRSGAPVAGARVRFLDAGRRVVATAMTAEDGTFASAAPLATLVEIACNFCQTLERPVSGAEPVIVIVRRYDALLQDGPSERDVDALPYAHVESALSLTPYSVFADSSGLLAGPVISDRGLSRGGGLVVDHGVANYDFAANVSPFQTIPSRALTVFSGAGAQSAFRYGDRADAGTFSIAPPQDAGNILAAGDDSIGRYRVAGASHALDFSLSDNKIERRGRFDVEESLPLADGGVNAVVLLARGTLAPFPNNYLDSSFDAARISAQVTRAQRRYADVSIDHGTYGSWRPGVAVGAQWSDVSMHAGVQSLGDSNAFLEVGARRSNGYYEADPYVDAIAGSLSQLQFTTGVQSHMRSADIRAGVSLFDMTYTGGPAEPAYVRSTVGTGTVLFEPSLNFAYHPDDRWNLDLLAASTFRLPSLLERYGHPPVANGLTVDRNALVQTTFSYQDLSRMRASVTAYRQNTTGLDNGSVSGLGASLAWQISPLLSVRTWFLHVVDTTAPIPGVARLTPSRINAILGSSWLSYDTGSYRIDAIYRRDLLDTIAYSHLDYAVSSRLGARATWFVGSEVRHRERFLDFGIRFVR